ncbi:hypothetical protein [Streptomyces platensis]|uniref:hypothetical protein n=1 Tax=Streptomyces platensis TaxID=58346 RepID=UPI0037BA113E
MLLPRPLRERLAADGWQVTPGRARNRQEAADPLFGDRLVCPACTAGLDKQMATAQRRHDAALARPRIKTLDLAKRLSPGWQLAQREGDAELERWLVEHEGTVHGQVNRYLRVNKTFSPGWEAHFIAGPAFYRLEAISSCAHRPNSSFLWSGRDLAAWGIATRPHHQAPRPAWTTRTRKTA